jgi:hypothetical protein
MILAINRQACLIHILKKIRRVAKNEHSTAFLVKNGPNNSFFLILFPEFFEKQVFLQK